MCVALIASLMVGASTSSGSAMERDRNSRRAASRHTSAWEGVDGRAKCIRKRTEDGWVLITTTTAHRPADGATLGNVRVCEGCEKKNKGICVCDLHLSTMYISDPRLIPGGVASRI